MATSEDENAPTAVNHARRIHIADLNTDYDTTDGEYVEAQIVLVWPYSSATKELSFLLIEKDVRLRSAKGQVKVTFHDAVAREVAKARPGIGDGVRLGLDGIEIVEEQDGVATPGKKAGFTLHSHRRVQLEVCIRRSFLRLTRF